MRPILIIGLGNPAMGDEGIGWHVSNRLAADPRLPEDAEVLWAGVDLLAFADRMTGRKQVTLLDAMLDTSEPGTVRVFEDDFTELENRQPSVHQLSAVEAIQLLRIVDPSLCAVRFKLIAISIESAEMQSELSPALAARIPALVDRVLTPALLAVRPGPG